MTKDPSQPSKVSTPQQRWRSSHQSGRPVATDLKALQRLKIRELRDALVYAGFLTLDAQANALGLRRSTTWAVLKANHKASGLSAAIINRMLESSHLPALARARILEYIEEKAAGSYGASTMQRRRFAARLSNARLENHHQDLALGTLKVNSSQ
jgi:hypothetical protein